MCLQINFEGRSVLWNWCECIAEKLVSKSVASPSTNGVIPVWSSARVHVLYYELS